MTLNVRKIFNFIIEIEKLKSVNRKIKKLYSDKYENSAEHSWQIAVLAILLEKYSKYDLNIDRVIKMLLIHDLGEIDTGDKHLYTEKHNDPKEKECVERLFNILPKSEYLEFKKLWDEFTKKQTNDARYANAIDRLMPLIQNLYNNGQSWLEYDTSIEKIFLKNDCIQDINETFWIELKQEIKTMDLFCEKGNSND